MRVQEEQTKELLIMVQSRYKCPEVFKWFANPLKYLQIFLGIPDIGIPDIGGSLEVNQSSTDQVVYY